MLLNLHNIFPLFYRFLLFNCQLIYQGNNIVGFAAEKVVARPLIFPVPASCGRPGSPQKRIASVFLSSERFHSEYFIVEIVDLTKCGKAADNWPLCKRGRQREPDWAGPASLTRSKHEIINGLFRLCGVERLRHRGRNDFGNGAGFAEGG